MVTYHDSTNFFILGDDEIDFAILEFFPDSTEPVPAHASVQGNKHVNTLIGDATDNLFNGRGGADRYIGGRGDDTYVVWDSATIIEELANEGGDIVQAFVSFIMPANVEALELNGVGDFSVTGNEERNSIYGNAGSNKILSQGGNDSIIAYEGNDTLDGGSGADMLTGGVGDDVYYVDNLGDYITEYSGEGRDTLFSSISYTLSAVAEVEVLTATGAAAIALGGSEYANTLYGNKGQNLLEGRGGNDTLYGEGGQDKFMFRDKLGTSKTDRKVNFDKLADFNVDDAILLDDMIFNSTALKLLGKKASVKKPKQLDSKFFAIGDKAKDKDDYVIYNKKTGVLSYDADGSGTKQAVEFAQLKKNLKITYKDFFLI